MIFNSYERVTDMVEGAHAFAPSVLESTSVLGTLRRFKRESSADKHNGCNSILI